MGAPAYTFDAFYPLISGRENICRLLPIKALRIFW